MVSAEDPDVRARTQRGVATDECGRGTLPQAILTAARDRPDLPVVFHSATRGTVLTLESLVERARRCAGAFHSLGVRPGDAVAVQVPSWVESVVAQAAALLVGAVLVRWCTSTVPANSASSCASHAPECS